MSYKTILTHIDQARNMEVRTEIACKIAQAEAAHVIGVVPVGISHYFFENKSAPNALEPAVATYLSKLRADAEVAAKHFEDALRRKGLASCETHVTEDDAFGSLERRLRYCDLSILGQYDPDTSHNPMNSSLVEDVLLGGGGPALIVPRNARSAEIDRRVLIAWNGSVEARRAVRDALPLLKRAESVQVAVFTPDAQGDEPGVSLQRFLKRHGVQVGLITQKATNRDSDDALLTVLDDMKADLMVMGCYGHSRFQETILGGVTRAVLRSMPVPVFMSH